MLICPLNFFFQPMFLTLSFYYNFEGIKRIKSKPLNLLRGWKKEKRKEGRREGGRERIGDKEGRKREIRREEGRRGY